MRMLWFLLSTVFLMHNAKAGGEHFTKADELSSQECSLESCGPNPLPIPMVQRHKTLPEAEESSSAKELMKTNFTCDDKPYIPGFYGDLETRCQVFHLCMADGVDHFLCPKSSTFDQRYLVCKSDGKQHCQETPEFYWVNANISKTFPIITGIQEFDLKKDKAQSFYQKLTDLRKLNELPLKRELIRIMVLLQFFEVSSIIPDLLIVEDNLDAGGRGRGFGTGGSAKSLLDLIINYIFPLFPTRYTAEKIRPVIRDEDLKAEPRT